jgi:thioredoxin reductase (NADPH)
MRKSISFKVVAIAGGLGSFEPRKPLIEGINFYENKGIKYFIKDPEEFRNKEWSSRVEEIPL